MHVAVDLTIHLNLDNQLELENKLDDGRGDETKELAKSTCAFWRHNLQAPILDKAPEDDNVHVVSRLSGLTQLLDANVTEEEKALDVLNSENLD